MFKKGVVSLPFVSGLLVPVCRPITVSVNSGRDRVTGSFGTGGRGSSVEIEWQDDALHSS